MGERGEMKMPVPLMVSAEEEPGRGPQSWGISIDMLYRVQGLRAPGARGAWVAPKGEGGAA